MRRSGAPSGSSGGAGCAARSTPRAFQCSIASSATSRSLRPISSSSVRTPSDAMIPRSSSATKKKKLTTCSGWPSKRLRSSGSCVAMPTGHVFRWQARIMMQPVAISGAVEKPNSSAPSIAAIATSRPVFSWPSVWTVMRERRSLRSSVCWVSARPISHGTPARLDRAQRRRAGAAVVAGDEDVVGVGLGDARGDGADADLGDELHRDRRARVRAAQVVDELLEVLDRVDVVVRRRRDQADARASCGAPSRCTCRPCGRGAGRPRRAWRPGPS